MQHHPEFLNLVNLAKKEVQELTIEELLACVESNLELALIDCREESEWQAGRLPGSIHISKGVIERDIEAKFPDKTATLVIYCGGGYRSILAAHNLSKMGYSQVHSLQEGYRGWIDRKLLLAQK